MKNKVGLVIAILVLLCSLGVLISLVFFQEASAEQDNAQPPALPTGKVEEGTIIDEVTGPGELKGSVDEKLEMAKWRYFKAFVAPQDQRVAAGTPLVEYTNGQALVAPYDLVVRSWNLPKKKNDALGEEHYVEVSRVDTLHMDLKVHENDISRLAVGQSASVTLGSDEAKVYQGVIKKISPIGAYETTGSKYTVTIEFVNDGAALIGMSAHANIIVGEAAGVLTVPVSAINDTAEGTFVMVMKPDGSMVEVPVETGLSDGTRVEVRGELSQEDQVLLNETSSGDGGSELSSAPVVNIARG